MKQILIIHGGTSFSSYTSYLSNLKQSELDYNRLKYSKKWSSWIAEQMPDVHVLTPSFPNGHNAKYKEWKIYFEKIIPFLRSDAQIIGHSLGAMFLAKYLHETVLPKRIRRIILVAGGYDDQSQEDMGSFLVQSAVGLNKSAKEVHFFHSTDDPVVPFTELAKFEADVPTAISHAFSSRGHFNNATFPELLSLLRKP